MHMTMLISIYYAEDYADIYSNMLMTMRCLFYNADDYSFSALSLHRSLMRDIHTFSIPHLTRNSSTSH